MSISVRDLKVIIGERTLFSDVTFNINSGDRVGLIGRNGAGKTTLTKTISGVRQASGGEVTITGNLGYLAQDTEADDPKELALDRIMSSRGLSEITAKMRKLEQDMSSPDTAVMQKAMTEYSGVLEQFEALGGYSAEADAEKIAAGLKISDDELLSELGTLSGGQRRRIELARILYSNADDLILDEPTNHLDADSIAWLRGYLTDYTGSLLIITHDTSLLSDVANRILYLDPTRAKIDIYNMNYKKYLKQREMDEERRETERAIATQTAERLTAQGNKMRAKATKAVAAGQMLKRAEKLLDSLEEVHKVERVADLRFPPPQKAGKVPLTATGLEKRYDTLQVWRGIDIYVDNGAKIVVLGRNGAGKTTLLKVLMGIEPCDSGKVEPGYGLNLGYFAQEHDTIDQTVDLLTNLVRVAPPGYDDTQIRSVLGSFGFPGDSIYKQAKVLSGGEKTRLALAQLVVTGANVLLLDEPTNNLDPMSREEILKALRNYEGAIILVTHDVGAVEALNPERVLLLPEGKEDLWSDSYYQYVTNE